MIVTQSILLYDSLDDIPCMEVYIVTILGTWCQQRIRLVVCSTRVSIQLYGFQTTYQQGTTLRSRHYPRLL